MFLFFERIYSTVSYLTFGSPSNNNDTLASGSIITRYEFNFDKYIELDGDTNDRIGIRINDNFSTLTAHIGTVSGYKLTKSF